MLQKKLPIVRHTLAILVQNEAGVLARVIGLFSARGYNIESLTVAEVDSVKAVSRITVITTGTPFVIAQIKNQINRLVCVIGVADLTEAGPVVEREMALFKIASTGEQRREALHLADAFRARIVDTTETSFVFEMTGNSEKIDAFAKLMKPLGLIDMSRTGVVAISRGANAMVYERHEL